MLEAMSHAKPIVASNIGPFREISQSKSAILLDREDLNAWVKTLTKTSSLKWKALGKTGQTIYRKNFTAVRMCQQTNALYKKLMSK
jgi:glycosyltransferase involved in cell wall biosynthesis